MARDVSGIQSSGDNATITQTVVRERPLTPLPPVGQVPVPGGLSNLPLGDVCVGRAEELHRLAEALEAGSGMTQAVVGLGGMGKSTLAAEYARRHAGRYAGVWWLTADSRANAEAGLADLARRLVPAAAADHDDRVLADWAVSWVQFTAGLLVVWDNVDDLKDVGPLLAALSGDVHHLITSRREGGWHRIGVQAPLRLGTLEPDDARLLLTQLVGPALDVRVAAELCAELGHLPLALEQVGAYLSEAGSDPGEYLTVWRTAHARAVAKAPESRPADRVMTGVWQITLDKLVDTPLAGDLLRVMAWLAPDAIPRALLAPVAQDPEDLAEALQRLHAYSMISLDPGSETVSVHRVVQAVARTADTANPYRRPEVVAAAQNTAIALLAALIPGRDVKLADALARWRVLFPHIDAFAGYAADGTVTAETIVVMEQAVVYLHDLGNSAAGIRVAACCLAGQMQHHGSDHPGTLTARNNLASSYESAGDLGKAIALHEASLADHVRVLGSDHSNTLISRNNLAYVYRHAGDLAKAILLYETNLDAHIRVQGEDHPHALTNRVNLASAYAAAGDLARAIPLLEAARAEFVRVLGKDHPHTLICSDDLASAYENAGDLRNAIALYEANFADRLRVLGEDHPHTLVSRNNLAEAYHSAGAPGKAITLHEAVLASRLRILGEDHPHTLISRASLARAYTAAGDPGRAIPLLEATCADFVRVLGKDHPHTLTCSGYLAIAYESVGDLATAISLFEASLADQLRVLGPDHPDTLSARNNLASARQSAGDLESAIMLHEATLASRLRVLGPDHPHTLTSRQNLANACQSAGDLGRAIPLYEMALADFIRVLGEDHPYTSTSRNNLANALYSAGDLSKAIPLLEASLATGLRVLGPDHPDTLTARNNLANAFYSAGDLGKAIPMYQETLADCVRVLGPDHPTTRVVGGNLAAATSERDSPDPPQQ